MNTQAKHSSAIGLKSRILVMCEMSEASQPTLSLEESRANHTPPLENNSAQTTLALSGLKCCESSERETPLGYLSKMLLASSAWRSTRCVLTWKRKATKRGRIYYQLAASARGTNALAAGLWRTVTAGDGTHNHCQAPAHKRGTVPLMLTVQLQIVEGKTRGWLNPEWTEWYMGYPAKWTSNE